MNTFTAPGPWAPPTNVPGDVVLAPRFTKSGLTVTPGASAAKSRKLRLGVGSACICCGVTLVAISEVRVSTSGAWTVTACNCTAPAASVKSSEKVRSEEHTSELQSLAYLVCRLLLEKKKKKK